jgi:hypothetical protein
MPPKHGGRRGRGHDTTKRSGGRGGRGGRGGGGGGGGAGAIEPAAGVAGGAANAPLSAAEQAAHNKQRRDELLPEQKDLKRSLYRISFPPELPIGERGQGYQYAQTATRRDWFQMSDKLQFELFLAFCGWNFSTIQDAEELREWSLMYTRDEETPEDEATMPPMPPMWEPLAKWWTSMDEEERERTLLRVDPSLVLTKPEFASEEHPQSGRPRKYFGVDVNPEMTLEALASRQCPCTSDEQRARHGGAGSGMLLHEFMVRACPWAFFAANDRLVVRALVDSQPFSDVAPTATAGDIDFATQLWAHSELPRLIHLGESPAPLRIWDVETHTASDWERDEASLRQKVADEWDSNATLLVEEIVLYAQFRSLRMLELLSSVLSTFRVDFYAAKDESEGESLGFSEEKEPGWGWNFSWAGLRKMFSTPPPELVFMSKFSGVLVVTDTWEEHLLQREEIAEWLPSVGLPVPDERGVPPQKGKRDMLEEQVRVPRASSEYDPVNVHEYDNDSVLFERFLHCHRTWMIGLHKLKGLVQHSGVLEKEEYDAMMAALSLVAEAFLADQRVLYFPNNTGAQSVDFVTLDEFEELVVVPLLESEHEGSKLDAKVGQIIVHYAHEQKSEIVSLVDEIRAEQRGSHIRGGREEQAVWYVLQADARDTRSDKVSDLTQALELFPDNYNWRCQRGMLLLRGGDFEAARDDFANTLLEAESDEDVCWQSLAGLATAQKKLGESRAACSAFVQALFGLKRGVFIRGPRKEDALIWETYESVRELFSEVEFSLLAALEGLALREPSGQQQVSAKAGRGRRRRGGR